MDSREGSDWDGGRGEPACWEMMEARPTHRSVRPGVPRPRARAEPHGGPTARTAGSKPSVMMRTFRGPDGQGPLVSHCCSPMRLQRSGRAAGAPLARPRLVGGQGLLDTPAVSPLHPPSQWPFQPPGQREQPLPGPPPPCRSGRPPCRRTASRHKVEREPRRVAPWKGCQSKENSEVDPVTGFQRRTLSLLTRTG